MTEETHHQLALLLAGEDPDTRRRAAENLAGCLGLAPIAGLAAALRDDDKGVRDAASRSLLGIGDERVARAIVEYIAHENIVTRNLAAELLKNIGTPSIPALLPYLLDPSQDVRKFAVDILGLIARHVPVGSVLPLLEDPDPNVILSAVEALGNMGNPDAVEALCAAFDRDEFTRADVAEALGKIREESSEAFLSTRLREILTVPQSDPLLIFAVIEALGAVGGEDALKMLSAQSRLLEGKTRSALLHAMIQIAERKGLPVPCMPELKQAFLETLRDDDLRFRVSAVKALSRCADADVVPALVGSLGASPELDAYLGDALAKRADAFPALVRCLGECESAQATAVVATMSRLTPGMITKVMQGSVTTEDEELLEQAFGLVAARWASSDEETRGTIVDLLFRLDGDRAVDFLDDLMNDPDPWLRMHVIELISAVSDRRAPAFIARFLEDDDEMVRRVAAETLRTHGFALLDEEGR